MRGHVGKRNGKWFYIVDTGKDQNGKRTREYKRGFATKKDADEALTDVLKKLGDGSFVRRSKETVAEFVLGEWLPSVETQVRPSTFASYARNMKAHVLPAIGGIRLQKLTPGRLNALYGSLKRRSDGSELSPRTVHYVGMIVGRMLRDAERWGRVPRNVARLADPPRVRVHAVMRTWSATELRRFLDSVREDRLYAAYLLAASTGMRRGEVLGLKWEDIKLEESRLSVVRTLTTSSNRLINSSPKTDRGRRSIALDAETIAALKHHRKRQLEEERVKWGPAYENQDLVFAKENGTPIHPALFSRAFDDRVKAAALPRIRLHDLRHTHATLALAAGIHPKVVSERLGHSNISITLDTYSHAIPAMQQDAADKVAALIWRV